MKKGDVVIGGVYLTYVSGALVRVRVTGTRVTSAHRTVFTIEHADGGRGLQPRSAAALRPAPKGDASNLNPTRLHD